MKKYQKAKDRFGKGIGSFCYCKYNNFNSLENIEVERFGVLTAIYDGLLSIEHTKKPERFWEIPADSITE